MWLFLSTPSARRATHERYYFHIVRIGISIHALREEGDKGQGHLWVPLRISIHALREEGDLIVYDLHSLAGNFYPRPPRGGRQGQCAGWFSSHRFLSTPSARRATPGSLPHPL